MNFKFIELISNLSQYLWQAADLAKTLCPPQSILLPLKARFAGLRVVTWRKFSKNLSEMQQRIASKKSTVYFHRR
jgi:hypothetical protein